MNLKGMLLLFFIIIGSYAGMMVQCMMTRMWCLLFRPSEENTCHARLSEMMLLIEFSHPQVTLNNSMASIHSREHHANN